MDEKYKKIGIVILGIILNVLGRFLVTEWNLPIWLDMTGTVVIIYLIGLWGGIVASIVSTGLVCMFDATALWYVVVAIVASIILHNLNKRGFFDSFTKAALSSFWLGMSCTVVSTPLNLILYNGYSNNIWGDTLVDMFKWYDVPSVLAAFAGAVAVEVLDKQICVLMGYALVCLCRKHMKKSDATKILVSILLLIGTIALSVESTQSIHAAQKDDFIETIYNNANGMVSSEANIISETEDGYIWIGSYAGLSRYDGKEFEFIREGGLVNVVALLKDSKGRLWIGTNDAGIARYENGTYTYFTVEDGLSSNSVRCFAEDKYGNIYVGTSDKVCRFTPEDEINILDVNTSFVKSMVIYNERLIVMDNKGQLFATDGNGVCTVEDKMAKELFYYCLAVTSRGFVAGTSTGELLVFDVTEDGMYMLDTIFVPGTEITAVYEDSKQRLWVGTDVGFGYLDEKNIYHKIQNEDFESSIDYFHEDYQGNIWIASSRYGVMKLAKSQFVNIFEKARLKDAIVNAVVCYDGAYYVGTDKGLQILDADTYKSKTSPLTEEVGELRVRALFIDSKERLWVCSYGSLICYSKNGMIRKYTPETDAVTSDRFRCITELEDGTIVVGTADGINYIENGVVTKTLKDTEGLENTQILSIVEGPDGTVWAGSDGSGIYVLVNGELVDNYTVERGLSSNVILRLVSYASGYLAVTSNAICHIDENGMIRRLSKFPYFNNYDVIVDGDTAYIPCSSGLYKTSISVLCADEADNSKLYGAREGLLSGLTANSWNYLAEDGRIFLCCNNGVTVFDDDMQTSKNELKYGIVSVECDGKRFFTDTNGRCTIPAGSKNISIYSSVRNYAFTDSKVRFYIKELDENPKVYEWDAIEPIQILKLGTSGYTVCMEIVDVTDNTVLQQQEYIITREKHPWESPMYRAYLIVVSIDLFLFLLISIMSMTLFATRKNELEKMQAKLEQKVDEQTEEIRRHQKRTEELFVQTVTALSEAVDAKDRYTSGHSKRVAEYGVMIARRMGKSKEELEEIYQAGLLHDVGKIRVPREIINKSGKLTDEEYNTIKIHPITGYHILRGISRNSMIAIAAKYHHERYDGKGYPNGLVGEKIPEVARILGVADSYDAMTSNRSYRKALPQDVVRSEIEKGKGTQFDPEIADIMLRMMDEDVEYKMKQEDFMQKKILAVDDETITIKLIVRIMKDEPMYEITSASSGKEALEILEQQVFDLILLDVKMPDMDGLTTLKLIREKYNTPVALMTSDKTLESATEFAALGCDDYITKPFQPLLLKETVHNMAERTVIDN